MNLRGQQITMKKSSQPVLLLLLASLVILTSACTTPTSAAPMQKSDLACDLPACANLVVTQDGQPGSYAAAAPFARPASLAGDSSWKIDTGVPSPDGAWVAYTSISSESGGPVLLQNMQSGEWINLIEVINAQLPETQPPYALDYIWDVIGWFPDSVRLMIGPVDLSVVLTVDLASYTAQTITFPGGGRGGRMFVNLSPDGKRLIYIGDDSSGNQVMNSMELETGQTTDLLHLPYQDGMLSNPRLSPDQANIAYLMQSGQPDPGLEYAIHLYSTQSGQTSLLVGDNLSMTVPTWSPDGRSIAFVRSAVGQSAPAVKGALLPEPETSSVWVVSIADGAQTQVTFLDGLVRSPTWANDSQTLAFVTGDGQVGLANLEQPGEFWQAAGTSTSPELTNVFFMP
jgi:Tol biopolymer transport system component